MAKKILIIEDDKFLRELMVEKLKKEGYEVSEAIDGEEGIKKTKDTNPDLILLDLILPGIDGFEVLARLKQDKTLEKIPVLILSNLSQKEDIEKGFALGAEDFLVKAYFTTSEIVKKIETVLNKSSVGQPQIVR